MSEVAIRHSSRKIIIDDEDYDLVQRFSWYLYPYRAPTFYACTSKALFIHRLLYPSPLGLVTAHKDGDGLNNRRNNLIHITNLENLQHKRTYSNNTSGVPGVKYKNGLLNKRRWEANINVMGKRLYLGVYKTFSEACEARFAAELKYRKGEEDE